jgi:hypothetical protein
MAHGRPRDPRKEQHWQRCIQLWRHSGLTVRAFCERHHLAEPSFYAWRRQLQQREAVAATLVPVQVIPEEPRRTSRRPGLPRKNPLLFYPRRSWEMCSTYSAAGSFYLWLKRLRERIERDPGAASYTDQALSKPDAPASPYIQPLSA